MFAQRYIPLGLPSTKETLLNECLSEALQQERTKKLAEVSYVLLENIRIRHLLEELEKEYDSKL